MEKKQLGECCSCGREETPVTTYKQNVGPPLERREHQHCDLCYKTLLGNACSYPEQYRFDRYIVGGVAWWIVDTLRGDAK